MRMIAGFEEPTGGTVFLDGQDVTGVSPNKRDVNMVFQSYALFPHLNAYQNVCFGLERKKVAKDEIRRRAGEIMEIVSLAGMEKRVPREMSGGQQQRVALARALVNRPRALLLDEPLGALDLKLRQQMQIELKRIQREVGVTFVYVTHDQGEALTMSDRIAVMEGGRIDQLGSPREIYEKPATKFVAGFIGTSNLLSGRVESVDNGLALLTYGAGDRVLVPVPAIGRAGRRHRGVGPAREDRPEPRPARHQRRQRALRRGERSRLPRHLDQLHGDHGRRSGIPDLRPERRLGRGPCRTRRPGVPHLECPALVSDRSLRCSRTPPPP